VSNFQKWIRNIKNSIHEKIHEYLGPLCKKCKRLLHNYFKLPQLFFLQLLHYFPVSCFVIIILDPGEDEMGRYQVIIQRSKTFSLLKSNWPVTTVKSSAPPPHLSISVCATMYGRSFYLKLASSECIFNLKNIQKKLCSWPRVAGGRGSIVLQEDHSSDQS